jgi:hypothetical protein
MNVNIQEVFTFSMEVSSCIAMLGQHALLSSSNIINKSYRKDKSNAYVSDFCLLKSHLSSFAMSSTTLRGHEQS